MPPRFICPYAAHNPSKYNAANRYKACMDPGFPTVARLKTHIKNRHYDEEQIPTDVRYELEQQRRKQRDKDKWETLYKILFPGEIPPSPFVTDSSLSSQGDLNDASQLFSTHLPAALEGSIPAERDGQLENIAAETILQDVQETSLSSTSRVPLIVGGLGNGIMISPHTDEPELDQVSKDIFRLQMQGLFPFS
ncbi:hypothetical protein V8E54_010370 [Elaphomyces granulatus]